jgi:hypothetical protein
MVARKGRSVVTLSIPHACTILGKGSSNWSEKRRGRITRSRSHTDCREGVHVKVERRKGEDRSSRAEIDYYGLATAFLS